MLCSGTKKDKGTTITFPAGDEAITLNTGDVVTVVVKIAIENGLTPSNVKAEWWANGVSGIWLGDYDFTTNTGYYTLTWTVAEARNGTVLQNIHLRTYDANNAYSYWLKSVTIEKA